MKLVFVLGFLVLNFVSIQSDVSSDILSELKTWEDQFSLALETAKKETVAEYVNQGIAFADANQILVTNVIKKLIANSRTKKIGNDLLKIFNTNQQLFLEYFNSENIYAVLSPNLEQIESVLISSVDEKVANFVAAGASNEAAIQNCWENQKALIENFFTTFSSNFASIFTSEPSSVVSQLKEIDDQRVKIFNEYVTKLISLKTWQQWSSYVSTKG